MNAPIRFIIKIHSPVNLLSILDGVLFFLSLLLPALKHRRYSITSIKRKRTIACEVYAMGKTWTQDELAAELTFFVCGCWFELKDVLKELYNSGDQKSASKKLHF